MRKTYLFLFIFVISGFLILKKVSDTIHRNKLAQVQAGELSPTPEASVETPTTSTQAATPNQQPTPLVNSNDTNPLNSSGTGISFCETTMLHCLYKEELLEYPSESNPWSAEMDNTPVGCFAYTSSCTNTTTSRPASQKELDDALETYRMNHPTSPTPYPQQNDIQPEAQTPSPVEQPQGQQDLSQAPQRQDSQYQQEEQYRINQQNLEQQGIDQQRQQELQQQQRQQSNPYDQPLQQPIQPMPDQQN